MHGGCVADVRVIAPDPGGGVVLVRDGVDAEAGAKLACFADGYCFVQM